MIKKIIILGLACLALPLLASAQETNTTAQPEQKDKLAESEKPSREARGNEFKKRHLKLMEKGLKEIGVNDQQRLKILILQEAHMEKMKANWKRMNKARRELSRLQDEGASMEKLEEAILELSDAQTEKLRILVYNRREMEQILGKEKYDLLMKKAREFFKKHGRRPGAGMPPRPDEDQDDSAAPPPPPAAVAGGGNAPPIP